MTVIEGSATPIDEAISLFGSFVKFLAITQKVICPGSSNDVPCSIVSLLHPPGKILETVTMLHFSIPACRNASSNDCK